MSAYSYKVTVVVNNVPDLTSSVPVFKKSNRMIAFLALGFVCVDAAYSEK